MDAAERFEKDYLAGRLAGFTDALEFVNDIILKLPKDQARMVSEKVWAPLHDESKRRRAEQS